MMKGNRILIIVILISLIAMVSLLNVRMVSEAGNKSVEIVLDYYEFLELAKQSDKPLSWWFEYFSEQGIGYVGLKEETLNSLVEAGKPLTVSMMGNLVKELKWEENYPNTFVNSVKLDEINPYDVVVYTDSREIYQFVSNALLTRYPEDRYEFFQQEEQYTIVIKGTLSDALFMENRLLMETSGKVFANETRLTSSKLTRLGLGLDPEKVQLIQDSGLGVMARPYSYSDWSTEKQIQATLEEYNRFGITPPVYIFDGLQVIGYPENIGLVAEHMRNNNIKVGLIETAVQRQHMEQDGINVLTDALAYDAVRIYSLPNYIQERFKYAGYEGAEEIENTLYRAVTERNIRLIYFKPFKHDKYRYVTNEEEYKKMLVSFEGRIAEHGLVLGESSSFTVPNIRVRHYTLMGWGIAAATVLLLSSLLNLKKKYILALSALGFVTVPALVLGVPSIGDKVLAMMASIVFASLSMAYFAYETDRLQKSKTEGTLKAMLLVIRGVLITSGISLVGALFVATILSDIKYLLEMDLYRGVVISQMIPFVFFIMFYLKHYGYKRTTDTNHKRLGIYWELKKLLFEDIKVIYVLITAFVLAAGYIYVARIGHETNIQASQLEILMRNILESKFLARPRTKEFLIGIPALMVGLYAAKRGYQNIIIFAAGFMAVLGQTSIINTFSHLRTPVYLSAVRTVYGIIFGILVGFLGVLFLELGRIALNFARKKLELE